MATGGAEVDLSEKGAGEVEGGAAGLPTASIQAEEDRKEQIDGGRNWGSVVELQMAGNRADSAKEELDLDSRRCGVGQGGPGCAESEGDEARLVDFWSAKATARARFASGTRKKKKTGRG